MSDIQHFFKPVKKKTTTASKSLVRSTIDRSDIRSFLKPSKKIKTASSSSNPSNNESTQKGQINSVSNREPSASSNQDGHPKTKISIDSNSGDDHSNRNATHNAVELQRDSIDSIAEPISNRESTASPNHDGSSKTEISIDSTSGDDTIDVNSNLDATNKSGIRSSSSSSTNSPTIDEPARDCIDSVSDPPSDSVSDPISDPISDSVSDQASSTSSDNKDTLEIVDDTPNRNKAGILAFFKPTTKKNPSSSSSSPKPSVSNQPPLELPERVSKEDFLENIGKKMVFGDIEKFKRKHCVNEEECALIDGAYQVMYDFGNIVYDDDESPFWNLVLRDTKHEESGIYYGRRANGKTKIGSAINIKSRTLMQKGVKRNTKLIESRTVMPLDGLKRAVPMKVVQTLKGLGLLALHYHPERQEELERAILLQVGEGIIGCAYPNDCPIFFETLVQMPSRELRKVLQWERTNVCLAYPNAQIVDPKLLKLIEFFMDIGEKGIHHLFSWPCLKHQICDSSSEFANQQRKLPKEGFLKNLMAVKRCGAANGGFTDAVLIAPSAAFIDEHVLEPLMRLLEEEHIDPDEIVAAFAPIMTSNGFKQYMFPATKDLASGSIAFLEAFLNNELEGVTMVQTQIFNLDAIKKFYPGWWEKHFDTMNQFKVCSSTFIKSKDGTKRMVVHPAHFEIFTPISPEKRLRLAKDYCLLQDVMIANGYVDAVEGKEDRLRLQCFLMMMEKGSSIIINGKEITPLRLAQNAVHAQGWFMNALPGIKATSDAMGIHEQPFIYVRDNIGQESMRKVVECFGLMKGNPPGHLAPFEKNAKCGGMPAFGEVPAKPCVCAKNQRYPLCYAGANSDYHPLMGYCVCQRCLQINMRAIIDEDLRLQGKFDELKQRKQIRAENTARWVEQNPEQARISDIKKHRKQDSKRVLDPVLREGRKRRKSEGAAPKEPGTNRRIMDPNKRYDDGIRKTMKRAVYIFLQKCGKPVLYNNHIIDLLDRIRQELGDASNIYISPEYTRCFSAFLTKDEKIWHPKDEYKPDKATLKAGADFFAATEQAGEGGFLAAIAKLSVDDTQMQAEKCFADKVDFGTYVAETTNNGTFEQYSIKTKNDSLLDIYHEWIGEGDYNDGIEGLDKKFGTKWRKNNRNASQKIHSVKKAIVTYLRETATDEEVKVEEIIERMESEFQDESKKGMKCSIYKFVEKYCGWERKPPASKNKTQK